MPLYNFKAYSDILVEAKNMSADEVRKKIITAANEADGRDLVNLLRAVEKPVLEKSARDLFNKRQLGNFAKPGSPILDEFINKIVKTKATTEEKIEFIEGCIAGEYFNAKGFTAAKSGTFTSFIKPSNTVMKQLQGWFLGWKPPIDDNGTVAVGKMEAVMIFLSADGGKGGDGDVAGDAYCGGKLVEVKTGGGHLGKDASTYFSGAQSWFGSELGKLSAFKGKSGLEKMALSGSTGQKNSDILAINAALKADGKKVDKFWQAFFKKATGYSVAHKGILDDPNFIDISAYATAVGFAKYKDQTKYDMVSLIDEKTAKFINWTSMADVIDSYKKNEFSMDYSLSWGGGGRSNGFSPRLYAKKKKYQLK